MDNITHTLTGLMLSRAGLDRLTPRAALTLMLAANVPDLDSIARLGGVTTYLDWHRGPTHGLPMLPLMALLPVAVTGLWRRPAGFSWGYTYLLACLGLLSHLLMDWTNIYGIRLLAPVSEEWFRLDITAVIDPWLWLVLGLAVVWPLLARLVNAEIGVRSRTGAGIARFALAFILLYDFGRYVIHSRALETLNSRLYAGGPPRQMAALPDYLNPLRWTGLVELPGRWEVHAMNLAGEFDPSTARLWYQAAPSAEMEEARRQEPFQALGRFSRTLLWQAVQLPGDNAGSEVRLIDLRFGEPAEGSFAAIARLGPDGKAQESRFQFRGPKTVMRPH